jgi:hypothetical protein
VSVYAIGLITIHDRDGYGAYDRGFMQIFSKFAGVSSPGRAQVPGGGRRHSRDEGTERGVERLTGNPALDSVPVRCERV